MISTPPIILLMVDNSIENKRQCRNSLQQIIQQPYTLLDADSGQGALQICQGLLPDVILLRDRLPDMTGLEFLQHLRQQTQRSQLPVIMLAEQESVAIAIQAIKQGAQHYFSDANLFPTILRDAIREVLEWGRSQTSPPPTDNLASTVLEEQHRLAVDLSRTGTWNWHLPSGHITWNDNHFRLLGWEPGEIAPSYEAWLSRVHPEDRERVQQVVADALATQTDYSTEYRIISPQGEVRWMAARGRGLYDETGQPVQMVGILLDISVRKQAELSLQQMNQELEARVAQRTEALQTSEARYRAIVEDQTELIVRFSLDGTILFVNEAYCRYFDQQRDDLIGRNYRPIIFEADRERVAQHLEALSADNPLITIENRVVIHGEICWTQWIIRMLVDDHGQTLELQAVGRDITALKQTEEALRLSDSQLKLTLEGSGVGLWSWNLVTGEALISPNWLGMLGYAEDELPASYETWEYLIHPEDHPWVMERLQAHLRDTSVPYVFDYRMRTKSGEWKWIANYGRVVAYTEQGTPLWMTGTHQDISDRKATEDSFRDLSDRLTLALKSGAIGTWDWDTVHEAYWDDRMYELYGMQRSLRIATYQDWLNAVHPEDRDATETALLEALQGERDFDVEFRIYRTDGVLRYIHASALIQRDEEGNPQRVVGINYDITERKQIEEALAIYTREVEDLYNNAPCGYHSLDAEGRYVKVNQTELGILGYTREEMLGQSILNFMTESSRLAFQQNFRVFLEQGWVRNLEYEFLCKDGTVLPVLISATAVKDAEGNLLYNRATLVDIRDRKQAEEQLRVSSDRLSLANAELARAARLKDEFLAGMSHELRTPLNAILGMSEALLEDIYGALNEGQRYSLQIIEQSGKHLLDLINDILDLSKIESGRMELEIATVGIAGLCESSLAFVRQQASRKHISLTLDIAEGVPHIQADERRLRQVLVNLLSNAVKFTPNGGWVELHVRADAQRETVEFIVIDTGIGIAPEQFSKLFQPFVQLDSSLSRRYEGTGLGLALVRRIMDLHGGSVSVESELGQGSRFTLAFPWDPQQSVAAPMATRITPAILPQIQQALIVEDSQVAANQIVRYLEELHAQAIVLPQGEEVVETALQTKPDLVILDILLPNQSGWEVLLNLKANPDTRNIPVLVISVLDERPYGLELGAAEYLVKPITRQQLQGAVCQLFARDAVDMVQTALVITPYSLSRPPLILLAEDQEDNIATMAPYLRLHGFDVVLARNGLEAIERAEQHIPDLILMDIQMPEMDGLEAIRRIRAYADLQRVPILALTALAMPGDRERCLEAGANEYLMKPISLKQLVKVISTYVSAQ